MLTHSHEPVASPVRYLPPPGEYSRELTWVLRAAFSEQSAKMPHCVNAQVAINTATALGLAPRVGGRRSPEWLAEQLDAGSAHVFARHALAARAAHERVRAAAIDVLRSARRVGVPVGVLKHGALWLGQSPNTEFRSANDLDILARPGDAQRLWEQLRSEGYADCGHGRRPHHMPTLLNPATTFVEVHWKVPGIKLERRNASLDALMAQGLARPAKLDEFEVCLPSKDFVAAHLLVHGYVQHGASPNDYPCLRMVGDLIDLDIAKHPEGFLTASQAWISHAVGDAEVRAVLATCDDLRSGYVPPRTEFAGTVLDHFVMARLDDEYASALRLWRLTELRNAADWTKLAKRLLAANPAELGVAPDTPATRLAWRSGRHRLHMLRLLLESVIAANRIRRRRSGRH